MRKKQFKAESKRLLDLMVNSIYTHKEIFLREIISHYYVSSRFFPFCGQWQGTEAGIS